MTFEKDELESYAAYMDFIRELIAEESKTKFTIQKYIPRPDEIEIGQVKTKDNGKWVFYYTISYIRQDPHFRNNEPFTNTITGMSTQISFASWKLLIIRENREKRIDELLSSLQPEHRIKLRHNGI
jgi:hypothetical protein